MGVNRRKFLKIAGISTLGVAAKPAADALAIEWLDKKLGGFTVSETLLHMFHKPTGFKPGEALTAERWAMVVNVKNCPEGCNACREACHRVHNVPDIENPKHEIKWIWHEEYEHTFPGQQHEHIEEHLKETPFVVLCNHCFNPPCVRVCPTKATFKRKTDGIVMMDMHRCIGCRFCMAACPYGSRSFNWKDPRPFIKEQNPEFPTRTKGVVEKCNFCAERLAKGQIPACVEACQEATKKKGREPALVFGDLEDPDSEVRQLLRSHYTVRRKPELGTNPNVYYIV
ncbi:MAG: 4Fe-4S dicluster domain-containing protein [Deltaproteobacteria bacterium]|nr:4Fe-4S dicluster domain-containing protein [Deltaproteobacteria bacterium]RLB81049.1 MAG: 4Fe-4S ferredoxin [Deltaproteobacteria bacterium]